MTDLIDQNELLYAYLTSFATLIAAAPGGIYGPPGLPDGWTPKSGRTLTFLNGDFSNNLNINAPETENIYRIHAYGFDNVDARTLYRTLYKTIHRKGKKKIAITGGNGLIIGCWQDDGPTPVTESASGWVYDYGIWRIKMMEGYVP